MCLRVSHIFFPRKARTLWFPKTVYKWLRRSNTAPFTGFQYNAGESLSTGWIKAELSYALVINRGFHAFRLKRAAMRYFMPNDSRNFKLVKMVIPSGAKYYKGYGGEIVSDRILTGNLEEVKL